MKKKDLTETLINRLTWNKHKGEGLSCLTDFWYATVFELALQVLCHGNSELFTT